MSCESFQILISPFYKWGSEKQSDFFKVTQPGKPPQRLGIRELPGPAQWGKTRPITFAVMSLQRPGIGAAARRRRSLGFPRVAVEAPVFALFRSALGGLVMEAPCPSGCGQSPRPSSLHFSTGNRESHWQVPAQLRLAFQRRDCTLPSPHMTSWLSASAKHWETGFNVTSNPLPVSEAPSLFCKLERPLLL